MRNNVSCLADILSQLGLSSRHLAEILNVHYSLVSKWLNNKRPLKYNSLHLKNLVNALISLENPRKEPSLKAILQEIYPDADLSTHEKIAAYLSSYLASDNPHNLERSSADAIDPRSVFARGRVDIYRKDAGRRDALMRLLDTAIALAPGQELLLFSEESLAWHIGDENFRREWLEKYENILRLGNRVTIVHTVDRQEAHLLHTITQWLPLHLTGKTRAFYYPNYSNSTFKPSLSVLRNQAVLSGMTVVGFSDMLYTYYSSNPYLVKQFELFFSGLLADSRPLFEKFSGDSVTKSLLDAAQRRGVSYKFSGLPLELALDGEDFCQMLRENGVEGEKYDQCADFFMKYRSASLEAAEACAAKQILDWAALEEGAREGSSVSQFNWILGGGLFVPPEYFKRGLRGLIAILKENKNFSLALSDGDCLALSRGVSLLIKENTIAAANSLGGKREKEEKGDKEEKNPCPLIMKEPTIVQVFFKNLTQCWNSIPRVRRDRENVIRRLEQLAGPGKDAYRVGVQ